MAATPASSNLADLFDALDEFGQASPFGGTTPGIVAATQLLHGLRPACDTNVIVFLGPSGIGKSHTVKQLIGLDPESDEFKSFPVASGNGTGIPQKSSKVPIRYCLSPVYCVETAALDGTETSESCATKEEFYGTAKRVLAQPDDLLEVIFRGPWALPPNTEVVDGPLYNGPLVFQGECFPRRYDRAVTGATVVVLLENRLPTKGMTRLFLSSPKIRDAVLVFGFFQLAEWVPSELLAGVKEHLEEVFTLPDFVRERFVKEVVVWSRARQFDQFWPLVGQAHAANLDRRIAFAANLCKSLAKHEEPDLKFESIADLVWEKVDTVTPRLSARIGQKDTLANFKKQLQKEGKKQIDVAALKQQFADVIFDALPSGLNYGPSFFNEAPVLLDLGAAMGKDLESVAGNPYNRFLRRPAERIFENHCRLFYEKVALEVLDGISEVLRDFRAKDRSDFDRYWKVPETEAVAKLVAVCDRVSGQDEGEEETGERPSKRARV